MNLNMKNIVLILIAVMLASFLMAGLLGATIAPFWGWTDFNQVMESIDETREFSVEDITEIQLETISTDINIIPVEEGTEIKVHLYGEVTPDILPVEFAKKSGNRLTVTIRPRTGINMNTRLRLTLDMYVPVGYGETLRGDTVSGDLNVADLDVKALYVKTVSGNLNVSNINLDTLDFQSVSGVLYAKTCSAAKANLKTISGNLDITNFAGDIDAKTVSGDLIVEYSEFANNITFDTTSGKTILTLPQESQFSIHLNTVSGNVDSEFPVMVTSGSGRNFEGTVGDGANRIRIKSVSGNVNLYQK